MRRFILAALLLCVSSHGNPKTVYTWLDDSNVAHFSDTKPAHHSAVVELTIPQSTAVRAKYQTRQETQANPEPPSSAPPQLVAPPLAIEIITPTHDQALRSNSGAMTIQAEFSRRLKPNEQVQLYINRKPHSMPSHNDHWQLHHLSRGSHTLHIEAYRDGKLIASSYPTTVHLLRATINSVTQSPVP